MTRAEALELIQSDKVLTEEQVMTIRQVLKDTKAEDDEDWYPSNEWQSS